MKRRLVLVGCLRLSCGQGRTRQALVRTPTKDEPLAADEQLESVIKDTPAVEVL